MQEDEVVQPLEPASEPAVAPAVHSVWRTALSWVRDLTFSVLIAVVLIVFIYQPVKVEGTSMEPSLDDQERIFINKFTYELGLGQIERGDTIVFWYPGDVSKSYIKRVIGLPGDRIRIDSGQVYVNDHALTEDYVPSDYRDTLSWPADAPGVDRAVPDGNYFVLGDHRSQSSDSRAWGFVPRKDIYGKAVFVYWPLEKMGRLR
jgi:signal peptidase I